MFKKNIEGRNIPAFFYVTLLISLFHKTCVIYFNYMRSKITYLIASFLLVLIAENHLFAQISHPATPPSFLKTSLSYQVPLIRMGKVDVEKLLMEDRLFDTIKNIPWRFGDNIYVNINPDNSGVWNILDNGDKIWRVSIESVGAYTINLTFNQYKLAPGAKLFVYNKDKSRILGAFTDYNNQDDGYFATTLVEGDHLTIEYFEPHDAAFPGELNLEMVTHAYRNPFTFAKSFGDSGSCNLNVACPEAEGWEQQIRSVGMLVTGGNGFCTGALINNSAYDQRPLFLSANHCYQNPSTVVFWFNWQSDTCSNPNSSPPYNYMSGATQIARHSTSDFWLMELNQPIPDEFNPYYAGWNRSLESVINETIIGVHHPRGDIKKFSYATGGLQAASYLKEPGSGTSHWHIVWSGGTTTERSSSGSPIFDSQGRILGQLHGGYAACGNTEPDWYGRLGISWIGGGIPANRLSDWLDPVGLGNMKLNGYDPFVINDPISFYAESISSSDISLHWQSIKDEELVMIAVNVQNIFGTPEGPYSLGEQLVGGGTIIYMGNDDEYIYSGLDPSTEYHFKIWSFTLPELEYSAGMTASSRTLCNAVTQFPFFEGFNNEQIPPCWQQDYIVNEVDWLTGLGNNSGYPDYAYEGNSNVFFRVDTLLLGGSTTKLISPVMELGKYGNAQLSFFYANPSLVDNQDTLQDTLRIMYKTHLEEEWQLLETFDFNETSWNNVTLDIPLLSDHVQIAFEGKAHRGKGISIDQVEIFAQFGQETPNPVNLSFTITDDNFVILNWENIFEDEGEDFKELTSAGIDVYRNNQLIFSGNDSGQENYEDGPLPVGSFTYYVQGRQADDTVSEPSNEVTANINALGDEVTLTLNISGQGNINPADGEYLFKPGSQLSMQAMPAESWSLSHWFVNDVKSGNQDTLELTMQENKNVEAVFAIDTWEVALSAEPSDAIEMLEGAGVFEHGETITISVLPETRYSFLHWLENGSIYSTKSEAQVVIKSDKNFVAILEPFEYNVEIDVTPEGSGAVSGEGTYRARSQVTLTATPEPGWVFEHWSTGQGEDETIISEEPVYAFVLNNNYHFNASFEVFFPALSLEIDGQGTTNPQAGEYSFEYGEEVTLNATPTEPWEFEKWIINGSDIDQQQVIITMEENTQATAVFMEPTDVNEIKDQDGFSVYPVPASQELFVVLPETGRWQIQVIAVTGQIMDSRSVESSAGSPVSLNLSNFTSGIYFVKAQSNGQVFYARIIIE